MRNQLPLHFSRLKLIWLASFLILTYPTSVFAVSLTSSPTLDLHPNAPLVAQLEFSTDVPTTAQFLVKSGTEKWLVESTVPRMDHSIPVFGLTADSNYSIDALHLDAGGGNMAKANVGLAATTDPLPGNFPDVEVFASQPNKMEPGYTVIATRGHTGMIDAVGDVRWYMNSELRATTMQPEGHLLGFTGGEIRTYDLFGNVLSAWYPTGSPPNNITPGAIPVETSRHFHHEAKRHPNGNYYTLESTNVEVDDFPTSDTDPNAPKETQPVNQDIVIEFAPDGTVAGSWNLADMLDPTRIGYGTFGRFSVDARDWSHANGVVYDESDDSYVVSIRHQDAVIKFDRGTGDLKWILGPHDKWGPELQPYLLEPTGDGDFEWPYHTHDPKILPDDPANPAGPDDPNVMSLLVHDNGNFRAIPFDPPLDDSENYSRSVEYKIDEENMTIEQVWSYGKDADEVYFSPSRGGTDWLPETNNILTDFADVTHINGEETVAHQSYIVEVDRLGEVVFGMRLHDADDETQNIVSYRSGRFPSLYTGTEFSATVVPEPSTIALLALSCLGGCGILRRRS